MRTESTRLFDPLAVAFSGKGLSTAQSQSPRSRLDPSAAPFQADFGDPESDPEFAQQRLKRSDDAVVINLSRATELKPASGYTAQGKPTRNEESRVVERVQDRQEAQKQEQELEQAKDEIITELKKRDREVRNHEQAHKSALGPHAAGGISLEFTRGPDGGRYAIAGEVPVDLSPESNPEKTIEKMRTIREAALAPQEPSAADRRVAAQASRYEAQARAELRGIERDPEATKEAKPNSLNTLDQISEQKEDGLSEVSVSRNSSDISGSLIDIVI